MQLARSNLTLLLNALYSSGETSISIKHPSSTIGELCRIQLGDPLHSEVKMTLDERAYSDARDEVDREHGSIVSGELPGGNSYINAFLAGGLLDPSNQDEIETFLDRHGSPDLTEGHPPVLAGFDTNLLAWRIADVIGLEPNQDGIINGFALATGVRDELDWDNKIQNTRPLEDALGPQFDRLWNQPNSNNREGRLGENYYRYLRDHRNAEEIVTDTGDEAIIAGYDEFQRDSGKNVLLFSNDRNFIEMARSHRVRAQRVEFPHELPRTLTGSWLEIQNTLYILAVMFGVLELPKVTLYGVWKGKSGAAWHDEVLDVDCRSPKIKPKLERDMKILNSR